MNTVQTILEQMGGNRMLVMTGAKPFAIDHATLALKLPANFARDGINHVVVALNGRDTYDVDFARISRGVQRMSRSFTDVYAEQLRSLFETQTGLATRL